ncbi:hypothetical protein [Helicobacter sp. 23-1045]
MNYFCIKPRSMNPQVLFRLFCIKTAQSHTAITSIEILRIAESNKQNDENLAMTKKARRFCEICIRFCVFIIFRANRRIYIAIKSPKARLLAFSKQCHY